MQNESEKKLIPFLKRIFYHNNQNRQTQVSLDNKIIFAEIKRTKEKF